MGTPSALMLALVLASEEPWRELVGLVCVDCHGGARVEGGVDLVEALARPAEHRAVWERAVDAADDGVMPPTGELTDAERDELAAGVLAALGIDPREPGRPTLRRLSRTQLARTLKDLLGVDVELARALPDDAAGYGFDTTGDTLFLSERWLELYAEALDAAPLAAAALAVPADQAAAAAAYEGFLLRAFRRPPTPDEVRARVRMMRAALADGAPPRAAFLLGIRAALLSPHFLYRVEAAAGEGARDLDGFELATRLSFFLWGSGPDPALLDLAAAGAVDPARGGLLAAMLADPRARWLAEDFAAQWLGTSELRHITPDVRRFQAFDEHLRASMRAEVEAAFADLVEADRSVLELLDSDHAFLNERLARHYGIAGVEHADIRRVPIDDRRRGGVLGTAAFLTLTSEPLRTSPVKRGRYILERLLAAPPAPPPPNAGALPEDDRQPDGLSLRARLERHRADPACAGCHARIDPYGLALEGFDGLGRARDDAGVDLRVVLPDGREVEGLVGLKDALRARPRRFVRAMAEHLFTYAVGRSPALGDRAALEAAVRAAEAEGYRFSALVRGIVTAPAFVRRGQD